MDTQNISSSVELWERQPGESVRNYEHFCAYRDMRYLPSSGDELPELAKKRPRSIRKLAAALGLSRKTIEDLSTRFRWVERSDAYDLHILTLRRGANEAAYLKMLENQAAVGKILWKRGVRRLQSLVDGEIEAADAVRMTDVGIKIERASREKLLFGIASGPGNEAETGISDETRREVEELVRAESEAGNTALDAESG